MINSCDLQTWGNVIVMIIAAVFTGIRMSRCKNIDTICCKCERELVDNESNSNNISINTI